mgnify:CR=1 FL=1
MPKPWPASTCATARTGAARRKQTRSSNTDSWRNALSGTGQPEATPGAPPPREVSFFFPAYNDAKTIAPLTEALRGVLARHCDAYEIIIVVDASPDNSGAVADAMAEQYPEVRAIHHPVNQGYGPAVMSGIRAARYDWVAFTDGDMQFDVTEFDRLQNAAARGADIVAGRRVKRADPWRRIAFSAVYNLGLRLFLGIPLHDMDCAFKLMRRRIFVECPPAGRYREAFVLVEVFFKSMRQGYTIAEVPVSHLPRRFGESQCFSAGNVFRFIRYMLGGIYNARIARRW